MHKCAKNGAFKPLSSALATVQRSTITIGSLILTEDVGAEHSNTAVDIECQRQAK